MENLFNAFGMKVRATSVAYPFVNNKRNLVIKTKNLSLLVSIDLGFAQWKT